MKAFFATSAIAAALLTSQSALAATPGSLHVQPRIAGHDVTVTTSNQLQLPYNPGSDFTVNDDNSVTENQASNDTVQGIYVHPSMSYHDLGATSFWYQEYYKALPNNGDFYVAYLGTGYISSQNADGAVNDAGGGNGVVLGSGAATQICTVAGASNCLQATFALTFNDGVQQRVIYRAMSRSNAVFEGAIVIDQNDFNAQQSTAMQDLDAMSAAWINLIESGTNPGNPVTTPPIKPQPHNTPPPGVNPPSTALPVPSPTQTPQPAPTPSPTPQVQPSITIDQTLIIHQVKGNAKATSSLKSKEKGLFVAVYHTANAGTLTPTGTITFTVNGKSLGQPDALIREKLDDGTTFMGIQESFTVKKKAVKVVAHFHLVLGTATADATRSFKVKPTKTK